MKKIILILTTCTLIYGVAAVVWEENRIEKAYILDK